MQDIGPVVLAEKIILFPELWETPADFISQVNTIDGWTEPENYGQVLGGAITESAATFLWLDILDIPEDLYTDFNYAFVYACNNYAKKYGSDVLIDSAGSMEVKKYNDGGHYSPTASNNDLENHAELSVIMMFPNDDYVGGEMVFKDYDLKYSPKKGDVLIYPATYVSSSLAATGANKYELRDHITLIPVS